MDTMSIVKKFLDFFHSKTDMLPIPIKITFGTSLAVFSVGAMLILLSFGNGVYHYFMGLEMKMDITAMQITNAVKDYRGKNIPVPWHTLCDNLRINEAMSIQVADEGGTIIYNGFSDPKFGQVIPDMHKLRDLLQSRKLWLSWNSWVTFFYMPNNGMEVLEYQNEIIFTQEIRFNIDGRRYTLCLAKRIPPQWHSFMQSAYTLWILAIIAWVVVTIIIYRWCKANFSEFGRIAKIAEGRIKSGQSLIEPLDVPSTYDEQAELITSINHLLAELSKKAEEQKVFMQGASHELRHPVSVILSSTEAINMIIQGQMSKDDLRMLKYTVSDIKFEAKSLSTQINQLSAYLDDKPVPESEMSVIDIDQLVKDEVLKARNINPHRVFEMYHREKAFVRVSQFKMHEIIRNLLENAVKYSPMNAPIQLSTKILPNKKDVSVEVRDFGIGISEKEKEEIFKPYYRVDQARTREGEDPVKGMGLGLAITKRNAESMGIKISVSSELGKGSIFTLTIPICLQENT